MQALAYDPPGKPKMKDLVKHKEWQALRKSFIGTWKETPGKNVKLLREFLGKDLTLTPLRRLQIVMNYLTGTGFRTGNIKHPDISRLRRIISKELQRRKSESTSELDNWGRFPDSIAYRGNLAVDKSTMNTRRGWMPMNYLAPDKQNFSTPYQGNNTVFNRLNMITADKDDSSLFTNMNEVKAVIEGLGLKITSVTDKYGQKAIKITGGDRKMYRRDIELALRNSGWKLIGKKITDPVQVFTFKKDDDKYFRINWYKDGTTLGYERR